MTRTTLPIAAALLAGLTGSALAAQPGPDWMPMDQVVRKLAEAGYTDLRSLKADDGRWEGKAARDGRPVSFTVDPRDGAVAEKAGKDGDGRQDGRKGGDKDDD